MELKTISEIETKEEAEQIAVQFQSWISEKNFSYGEIAEYSIYFDTLGKKFGLIEEFKENGII